MMGLVTFASLGQVQMPEVTLNFTSIGFNIEGEATDGGPTGYYMYTWPFFVIALLSAILPLINIFTYRNLKLQKRLCWIEMLFIVTTCGVGAIYGYYVLDGYTVSWSSVALAPVIAVIADWLAYNRINHDDKLIKSADRLR